MLRRVLCVLAMVSLFALGLSVSAHADITTYTETFQNTFASLPNNRSWTGSVSPYPTWWINWCWPSACGTAKVETAGTLQLDNSGGSARVFVTAASLVGTPQFDVSANPLTVTATLAMDGVGAAEGAVIGGLLIGNMQIFGQPTFARGDHEFVRRGGTDELLSDRYWTDFNVVAGVPFTLRATLSNLDATHYTLEYKFGTGTPFSMTVLKTDTEGLSSVGARLEANGWLKMTSFSVDFWKEVPAPSTVVLLATGLVGLLGYAWRQRK